MSDAKVPEEIEKALRDYAQAMIDNVSLDEFDKDADDRVQATKDTLRSAIARLVERGEPVAFGGYERERASFDAWWATEADTPGIPFTDVEERNVRLVAWNAYYHRALSAPPAPTARDGGRMVVVDNQGVLFGPNCWISHDRIVGCDPNASQPEREAFYRDRIMARQYVEWVNTPTPPPAPATGEGSSRA